MHAKNLAALFAAINIWSQVFMFPHTSWCSVWLCLLSVCCFLVHWLKLLGSFCLLFPCSAIKIVRNFIHLARKATIFKTITLKVFKLNVKKKKKKHEVLENQSYNNEVVYAYSNEVTWQKKRNVNVTTINNSASCFSVPKLF